MTWPFSRHILSLWFTRIRKSSKGFRPVLWLSVFSGSKNLCPLGWCCLRKPSCQLVLELTSCHGGPDPEAAGGSYLSGLHFRGRNVKKGIFIRKASLLQVSFLTGSPLTKYSKQKMPCSVPENIKGFGNTYRVFCNTKTTSLVDGLLHS